MSIKPDYVFTRDFFDNTRSVHYLLILPYILGTYLVIREKSSALTCGEQC